MFKRILAMLVMTMVSSSVLAKDAALPLPEGPVILTIEGAIERTNRDGVAEFDRAMLKKIGMHSLETTTPWSDGVQHYEGPLMRDLLAAVGASGSELKVTALNDYSAPALVSDYHESDVILALKENGAYMRVRDKGPLFIVYPYDSDPQLHNELIYSRSVWQIKSIRVE